MASAPPGAPKPPEPPAHRPDGEPTAIAGAKLGYRAAIVDRGHMMGGVCINTGTIPSKTLREAVLYLTGLSQRELYGQAYRVKQDITIADVSSRISHVVNREIDVIRNQLARNHVAMLTGTAKFIDDHTVTVIDEQGTSTRIGGDKFVIGVGTKPARPSTVEFDGETIVDSDQILGMGKVRSSMVVVGAGVIGIEYASMFAALGTKVTVVEPRPSMLSFCDDEIVGGLLYQLRDLAVTFRFSETVRSVEKHPAGTLTTLESGKKIPADTVLYSAGRQGVTDELNVAAAGISASNRGRVEVNEHFQTEVEHTMPSATSSASRRWPRRPWSRARRATYHAFGEPVGNKLGDLQPIGIYPTLAESYKVAALDAVNKMRAIAKVTQTAIYHPLPE
jgi:NAD(P) transhydrogenase